MADSLVLTNVWAAILAFAVFMYVVMDGFDLGIGAMFRAENAFRLDVPRAIRRQPS